MSKAVLRIKSVMAQTLQKLAEEKISPIDIMLGCLEYATTLYKLMGIPKDELIRIVSVLYDGLERNKTNAK